MNFITTIVKRFLPKEIPMPVGRWRIEHCNTKMNQKIDLSNEDHCGPCGQYALDKTQLQTNLTYKLPNNSVPPYMPRSGIVAK
jgi:hypothetical protein